MDWFLGSQDFGVSTTILNYSNTFDPYNALSTPLYQTATFKQVKACLKPSLKWVDKQNMDMKIVRNL